MMGEKINTEVAWIDVWDRPGNLVRLNPTGRWKVWRGPLGYIYLLIEHKGPFYRKWVNEFDICFMPADFGTVFECGKGNE